jgi:hypothetical protein
VVILGEWSVKQPILSEHAGVGAILVIAQKRADTRSAPTELQKWHVSANAGRLQLPNSGSMLVRRKT